MRRSQLLAKMSYVSHLKDPPPPKKESQGRIVPSLSTDKPFLTVGREGGGGGGCIDDGSAFVSAIDEGHLITSSEAQRRHMVLGGRRKNKRSVYLRPLMLVALFVS